MFLNVKDLCRLYNGTRSESWCYDTYRIIKQANNLNRREQLITVKQFCNHMLVDAGDVREALGWTVTTTAGR